MIGQSDLLLKSKRLDHIHLNDGNVIIYHF